MIVDIDYIIAVKKRFAKINAEELKDITWIKDGEEVEFNPKDIENFEFTGLNNVDILSECKYKPKQKETKKKNE